MPATEKECYDHGRAGDHRGVLTQEKERKLHRAVLGVITAGQLLLGLRQIERQAIRFGKDRYRKNDERDEHGNGKQPFTRVEPVAKERSDKPSILNLITNDIG